MVNLFQTAQLRRSSRAPIAPHSLFTARVLRIHNMSRASYAPLGCLALWIIVLSGACLSRGAGGKLLASAPPPIKSKTGRGWLHFEPLRAGRCYVLKNVFDISLAGGGICPARGTPFSVGFKGGGWLWSSGYQVTHSCRLAEPHSRVVCGSRGRVAVSGVSLLDWIIRRIRLRTGTMLYGSKISNMASRERRGLPDEVRLTPHSAVPHKARPTAGKNEATNRKADHTHFASLQHRKRTFAEMPPRSV